MRCQTPSLVYRGHCKPREASCLSVTSSHCWHNILTASQKRWKRLPLFVLVISDRLVHQQLKVLTSLCTKCQKQMARTCLCTYSTYVGQVHQDRWLPWELGIKHDCNLWEIDLWPSACSRTSHLLSGANAFGLSRRLLWGYSQVKVNNVKARSDWACGEFPLLGGENEDEKGDEASL